MKHIVRIFLILVALIVLLAGIAVLTLYLLFPPVKLQRMAVDGIRGFLNREARIERLTVGLSGLDVKNFAVSEYPDFREGTFLKGDELRLRWRLLPLLRRQRAAGEALLVAPVVEVYRIRDGVYNYSDLSGVSLDTPHKAAFLPALLLSRLSVRDGTVLFKDSGVTLRHVDLSADGVSPAVPFNAVVSFTLEKDRLRADLAGTVAVDPGAQTLEFNDATLAAAGNPALRLSGRISDFAGRGPPRFEVIVKGDRAALESLTALVPELSALRFFVTQTISLTISGTADELKIAFNK